MHKPVVASRKIVTGPLGACGENVCANWQQGIRTQLIAKCWKKGLTESSFDLRQGSVRLDRIVWIFSVEDHHLLLSFHRDKRLVNFPTNGHILNV